MSNPQILLKVGLLQSQAGNRDGVMETLERLQAAGEDDLARILKSAHLCSCDEPENAMSVLSEIERIEDLDSWVGAELEKLMEFLVRDHDERQTMARCAEHLERDEAIQVAPELAETWRAICPSECQGQAPALFFHISHCGGASIQDAFIRLLSPHLTLQGDEDVQRFRHEREEARGRVRFLVVHRPAEISEILPKKPTNFTVVRNPLRRFVGGYFRSRLWSGRGISWVDPDIEAGCSLSEYVEIVLEGAKGHHYPGDNQASWFLGDRAPDPASPMTASDYDEAFRIADEEFDFVGITEYFVPTLAGISLACGLPVVPKWRLLGSGRPPDYADLDPALIQRMNDFFAEETVFYERLKTRFEDKYAPLISYVEENFPDMKIPLEPLSQSEIAHAW